MPIEIWNQGRVTGYSAYEIYVRQHIASGSDTPPATEREWLASTVGMGSSMLLSIDPDSSHDESQIWYKDIQFPSTTRLCAANTIIASYFAGSANYQGNWATRITDYGPLISNTASSAPNGSVGPTSSIPAQTDLNWSQDIKLGLSNYLKIIDGLIIQPGNWSDSSQKPPEHTFSPDLGEYPRIRLMIKGRITHKVQILLTGFTIRPVILGTSELGDPTNSPAPEDGDFLGPGQYPWASKVIFSVPSSYITYYQSSAYTRKLPKTDVDKTVSDTSVIDMRSTDPKDYYEDNYPSAKVEIAVSELNALNGGCAVISVYQRNEKFPPAIWASLISETGNNAIYPLDTVAPNSVKLIDDASLSDVNEYQSAYPGTHALSKSTSDDVIKFKGSTNQLLPIADQSLTPLSYTNLVPQDKYAQALLILSGHNVGKALSLSKENGDPIDFGQDTASNQTIGNTKFDVGNMTKLSPSSSNITWAYLLEALANDKSIDLLGNNLKAIKAGLPKNYIQFPNGLRLYISSTEPTDDDVPIGSIGIGWGFTQ